MKLARGTTLNIIPDPSESTKRKRTPFRRFVNWTLALIGVLGLRIWLLCGSTELRYDDEGAAKFEPDGQYVFASWHEQLFGSCLFLHKQLSRGYRFVTLISPSVDGDAASNVAMRCGADVVRGSATRSGFAAMRALISAMRKLGSNSYVVTDGPKGPARESKSGALLLARMTGAWFVPMACASNREKRLDSWDRFRLPSPFARTIFLLGAPRQIPREMDEAGLERAARELDAELERLTAKAKQLAADSA